MLDWIAKSENSVKEFGDPGLFAKCFPSIFSYGMGDPTIGHLVRNQVRETWQADAADFEDGLRLEGEAFEQEHANAIEFEETVRVDSSAPSTTREFRRIWSKFQNIVE